MTEKREIEAYEDLLYQARNVFDHEQSQAVLGDAEVCENIGLITKDQKQYIVRILSHILH